MRDNTKKAEENFAKGKRAIVITTNLEFPFPDKLLSRSEVEEMTQRKGPRLDAWLSEWGVMPYPKSNNPNPQRSHRVWSRYDIHQAIQEFKKNEQSKLLCQAS